MTSALSLMTKPVQTLSSAAQGGRAFTRVGEGLFGSKRSQSEESQVKDLIGFASTKREYIVSVRCRCLFRNQKLQDILNRISSTATRVLDVVRRHGGGTRRRGRGMTVVGADKD